MNSSRSTGKRRLISRAWTVLVLALALALATTAQSGSAPPFLWRIQGPAPSYLFGTIHLPDARVLTLPPAVEQAFVASDAVYTEIPLTPMDQMKASASMLLPPGQRLQDLLPDALLQRVTQFVEKQGRDMALFDRFTIWSFMVQLSLLEDMERYLRAQPMDFTLYQRAKAAGKEAAGLETVEEQIGVFGALTTAEQVELLAQTMDYLQAFSGSTTSATDKLTHLYLSGDMERLVAEMQASIDIDDPVAQKFNRLLLDERNVRMAERITGHLRSQPERSFFFAVGALHHAGPEGIPALLRQAGFQVQRVGAGTDVPEPVAP